MLKIKDNVDLKELEKYGFHSWGPLGELHYCKSVQYTYYNEINYVVKEDRKIQINTYDDCDSILDDTLYDLIKADMVEKVSD